MSLSPFISVYYYGERWIVPTTTLADAGYFLQMEPVYVSESRDVERHKEILERLAAVANSRTRKTWRDVNPPVVLKAAGVADEGTFNRAARLFTVKIFEGGAEVAELPKGKRAGFSGKPIEPTAIDLSDKWDAVAQHLMQRVGVV